MPLGFVTGPEDLLVDAMTESRVRIDKAYSWEAPLAAARADAHGDPQRLGGRSLPDRHAVPLHGQHGVELVDEHGRARSRMLTDKHEDGDAGSTESRSSSIPTPTIPETVRLCRPRAAGHHLSRAPRLHQPARPADQPRRWAGRRDPPAGDRARPRRAAVPGRC